MIMVTKRTMHTSVEAMDAFLIDMIIQDIKNSTDLSVDRSDIKAGFSYSKKIMNKTGKHGRVNTRIEQLESGLYQVAIESKTGINYIKYSYKSNSDNSILLEYSESFESDSKLKGLNHSIMSRLYNKSTQKRVNILLNQIDNLLVES